VNAEFNTEFYMS